MLRGYKRQHALYASLGVGMCAGLEQVWVRIIMLYNALERSKLVLALYKHALLLNMMDCGGLR